MNNRRKGRTITLQDIARQTGYSVNTVSHALRNKEDIARETRDRIQQVAREMGYTGNQIASSLRSGRTHLLALILGGLSNPFYGIMADTLQHTAGEAGYSLIIMCSQESAEQEANLVEQAIARRVDGIILFPTPQSARTVDRLIASDVPFVLMSRYLEEGRTDCVVCDEVQGAYLATRHLIEAGHRKLAHLSAMNVLFSSAQRERGFIQACDECGIPEEDRAVLVLNEDFSSLSYEGLGLAQALLRLKSRGFDGLFVFCDVESWHVMDALRKLDGLSPDDFGIVSFDDLESALAFPLPICSVNCNYRSMARSCIELLRSRIHDRDLPPRTVVCPVTLLCRGSCARHEAR